MDVLMLMHEPPLSSSSIAHARNFNLVRDLSQRHRVAVVSLAREALAPEEREEIGRYCQDFAVIPFSRARRQAHPLFMLQAMLRGQPPLTGYYASAAMWKAVRRLSRKRRFEIVHVEDDYVASYLGAIEGTAGARKILFKHNVLSTLSRQMQRVETRPAKRLEYLANNLLVPRWERRTCRRFDRCVVFSEEDRRQLVSRIEGLRVDVVRYGLRLERFPFLEPARGSEELLFVGKMSYAPNRDAVVQFCKKVLPLILARRPNARLNVVGQPAMKELERMAPGGSVNVAGYAEDLTPWYRRAALAVVPLRAGSGVRGKILESMALGRPVVSTSVGCEGLDVRHGQSILIADTPEAFANSVLHLLSNDDEARSLAAGGRRLVMERHDWRGTVAEVCRVYEAPASLDSPRRPPG